MGTANISFGHMSAQYSRDAAPVFSQSGDAENLTTTNASATASSNAAPSNEGGRDVVVRIMLSEEGYIRVNGTPTVGTGLRLIADIEYIFAATPGVTVSVIDTV